MHQREAYDESKIRHLEDTDHIRTRPGMYIGRLGDGSHAEDGIYVLLKETIDNSIDEFNEGFGKRIEVDVQNDLCASVRDYGRGIPLGSLVDAVSKLNTGAKYDTAVFTASVGLNGVGLKAVNALSQKFIAASYRDGKCHRATFERGILVDDVYEDSDEENGTYVYFEPDPTLFLKFRFQDEFVDDMLRNYTYLNTGLAIFHNGRRIISRNGLEDLLNDKLTVAAKYPHRPPHRRGHRHRLHPHRPVRRRILLLRERPAYHAGRHPPERFQGAHRPRHQRILRQKFRRPRRAQRPRRSHRHSRD